MFPPSLGSFCEQLVYKPLQLAHGDKGAPAEMDNTDTALAAELVEVGEADAAEHPTSLGDVGEKGIERGWRYSSRRVRAWLPDGVS